MPVLIQNNASEKFKPSFAPSANVQLCVRANGDEDTCVIDPFGYSVPASIPAPTVAPTCAAGSTAGAMNTGKWVAYAYVWAASRRYPYVEGMSVGGNLYPRGNPSPASAPYQIVGGSCDVTIQYPDNVGVVNTSGQVRSDLDRVWIFRTIDFDNSDDCATAASAGDFYYVDFMVVPAATPPGISAVYTDQYQTPTDDIAEYDNYGAPLFQFCVFCDPYWYGFGNFPLKVKATWDANGLVHLDPSDPNAGFYSGRKMQPCYIQASTDDGDTTNLVRQYYAAGVSNYYECKLVQDLNMTPVAAGFTAGSGYIIFNGPSTTLYRSKYRNPMAWGDTSIVGDIRVPYQYVLKVGGGIGTGIAQVPNLPLLVLSTKGPAATYVLDLRVSGTDQFAASLKCISTLFSVTSHFSQFAAMLPNGQMVLYGHDADNRAVTACDGNSVVAVSDPYLSATMRSVSEDPKLLRQVHGLYDPETQHNCMWLPQYNMPNTMNLLVSQSGVTGSWHTHFEGDVLSSAIIESTFCSLRKLYLGTSMGHFGVGLDDTKTRNWLQDSCTAYGLVASVPSNNSLVLQTALPANSPGVVGLWILTVAPDGGADTWVRIAAIGSDGVTVTFDLVWSPGNGVAPSLNSDLTIYAGNHYYIGLIECSLQHFFDFGGFADDKKLEELWIAMSGVDTDNPTSFQFIRDRGTGVVGQTQNFYVNSNDGEQSTLIPLEQVKYDDGVTSQQWKTNSPPTEQSKAFGLRVIDRGYGPWRTFGWGGKRS